MSVYRHHRLFSANQERKQLRVWGRTSGWFACKEVRRMALDRAKEERKQDRGKRKGKELENRKARETTVMDQG